ncbi:MAG: hypothetical protein N3D75_02820 [Candidatus Aenigmarchaeota archaeon]|nr:hypothetical protein [Candidatus Aenigmarchaeota archaeon]
MRLNPIILFVLIGLADIALYITRPFGDNFYILADLLPVINSSLFFLFAFLAYKPYGYKNIQGKSLFFMFLGALSWFLAETAWFLYELNGIMSPKISLADFFWLLGYPFFIIGIFNLFKISKSKITTTKIVFSSIITLFVTIFTLILIEFSSKSITLVEEILILSYVFLDSSLLLKTFIVVSNISKSEFFKSWSIILLSFSLILIADIIYYNIIEIYETGEWIDLLWILSYLSLAYGFYHHLKTTKKIIKS